jgi:hypothetical protein
VLDGRVLSVDERRDLPLGRLDHLRVAVTGAGDSDAGGEVQVSALVLVEEKNAFPAGGHHAGRLLQDGGELGHHGSLSPDC